MTARGAFSSLCVRKAPRTGLVAAIALVLTALAPGTGGAAQTSLADVEDEVMCPICGTLLELSESPQAERQRAFVARQIAAGRSKEQIKDALVAEYGRGVLAVPGASGFDLSAYLVPVVAFAAALLALAIGVGRWRRAGGRGGNGGSDEDAAPPAPRGDDAERLDADLARYDL